MANFDEAVIKTLLKEGGAKLHQVDGDAGGLTKYGISQRAYPKLDIKNLSEAQACEIYKRDYWQRIGGNDINSQAIAESIFDAAVNMGVKTASRLAQLAADINPADGALGNASISVLNDIDEGLFMSAFIVAKIARYAAICNKDKTQSKFLLGWINRTIGGA